MPGCVTANTEELVLIPVSVVTLVPQTVPGVSLYVRGGGEAPRLYRGPEIPVTQADLDNLKSRSVATLFVAADEYDRFQSYVRGNLAVVLNDESVPIVRRMACLNTVVRECLVEVFRRGNLDERVEQTARAGRED